MTRPAAPPPPPPTRPPTPSRARAPRATARAEPVPVEDRPEAAILRGARKPALAAAVIGSGLIAINIVAMSEGVFFPKALGVGVAIVHVALAMFVFPGQVDLPMFTTRAIPLTLILDGLEPTERMAWLGATLYGSALGLMIAAVL